MKPYVASEEQILFVPYLCSIYNTYQILGKVVSCGVCVTGRLWDTSAKQSLHLNVSGQIKVIL